MFLDQLQLILYRAIFHTFSKKKLLLLVPIVLLCGLLTVICMTLASLGQWAKLSLFFLPIFVSFGLLLGVGIVLTRIYFKEIKGFAFTYFSMFKESMPIIMHATYMFLMVIASYVALWIGLTFFYLLKYIPWIGPLLSAFFSFVPFLIVISFLILTLLVPPILFFVIPYLALKGTTITIQGIKELFFDLKQDIFTNIMLFVAGVAPFLLLLAVLSFCASFTSGYFFMNSSFFVKLLQQLVVMILWCLFLTPTIIFFFNFSTESFGLIQKNIKNR
ncbi:MAG: hypothetical protein HY860_05450 [Chlamydiales bacterium]|nr:hypothetical protein [Chlamydiales bacterium]